MYTSALILVHDDLDRSLHAIGARRYPLIGFCSRATKRRP